jgi:acyl-coenzyme A synthetase/AMP-(fatty) acid ligase
MFLISDDYLDRVALVCNDGYIVTYKELKWLVNDFSTYLDERSLIFLLGSNDLDSLVCYFASMDSGVVPLLLSENIKDDQLNNLIDIYSPKYIFSKRVLNNDLYLLKDNFRKSNLFSRDEAHDAKLHDDLALLLTTSGSTGSPKLVKLTKENIKSNAESISEYLKIGCDDRAITSLPFNYSYGLSVINSHLFSGGSIILSNSSMMEDKFWKSINDHSATSIAGVPYHYEMMLRLGIDNLNIQTVNKMTQAGGKLNYLKAKKVNDSLRLKGIDFYTMYGQTEATARISYLPCGNIDKKPNSIGIPIPGGKLWLEDEQGSKISDSMVVGELIFEGANVSMGYAESINDLSSEDVNKGILRTGDLAYFDEDGYYFIEGRNNHFIKVFGNRISLDSLEKLITTKGFDSVATGVDDKIVLYVIEAPNLSVADLRKEISESIGINMVAIKVTLVDDFPRLESGKINYKALNV